MKKVLLLSAVVAAAMSANAWEPVVYDFNTTAPAFTKLLATPAADGGLECGGNYDFVDKTGNTINMENTMLNEKGEDGEWHGLDGWCISLEDGAMWQLDQIPADHVYFGWNQGTKGPGRTLWMKGWGTLDAWVEKDYNAAFEEDWVATNHAISIQRNANTGVRQGYLHFPAVQAPAKMTFYIGNAGGNYAKQLDATVYTLTNGVRDEGENFNMPEGTFTAKRYYKYEYDVKGDGMVNVEIATDNNMELHIYHVVFEAASSGVENVMTEAAVENAPVYNVMGVQVDENYKGLVIKNGKKYIQK